MKKNKLQVCFTPNEVKSNKSANRGKKSVSTNSRKYLTADELFKVESADVSDNPVLEEYKILFMEQIFSSAHDRDMVSDYEKDAYHRAIAELLLRAGIVGNSKPKTSFLADLGFHTSAKVIGEFRFVDSELPNPVY